MYGLPEDKIFYKSSRDLEFLRGGKTDVHYTIGIWQTDYTAGTGNGIFIV